MTLPKITNKQQEIIKLIPSYRFINRVHIQTFLNHKDKKTINTWLKDLRQNTYIERIYKTEYGENTKPAVFYIGINGIRFLKQLGYPPDVIRKLYREASRKEPFIARSLLLVDICLNLKSQTKDDLAYSFTTACDYAFPESPFHFLKNLAPQLVFSKERGKTKNNYLVEIFDSNFRNYKIRSRLRKYFDFFYSNSWLNHARSPFPTLLFICPTKDMFLYAKKFTRKLLEDNQHPKDLHIKFTTADEVKKFGVTSEIWEEM